MIPQRALYMDLLAGYVIAPVIPLIPRPETLNNVNAIGKPFQLSVNAGVKTHINRSPNNH